MFPEPRHRPHAEPGQQFGLRLDFFFSCLVGANGCASHSARRPSCGGAIKSFPKGGSLQISVSRARKTDTTARCLPRSRCFKSSQRRPDGGIPRRLSGTWPPCSHTANWVASSPWLMTDPSHDINGVQVSGRTGLIRSRPRYDSQDGLYFAAPSQGDALPLPCRSGT